MRRQQRLQERRAGARAADEEDARLDPGGPVHRLKTRRADSAAW